MGNHPTDQTDATASSTTHQPDATASSTADLLVQLAAANPRIAKLLAQPAQSYDTTAELMGTSRATACRLVKSGALPHVKIGRLVRIPTAAILEAIGASEVSP